METREPSPGGKYIFQISPWEARMSLWVETPRLVETVSGKSLLDFKNRNWSLDEAEWLDEERVKVRLRCYPGDHSPSSFRVLIDCARREAIVEEGEPFALDCLEEALEAAYLSGQFRVPSHKMDSRSWAENLRDSLKRWFG